MKIITVLSGIMLALDTVREHKMRSFLTVLGVIIGTATIIGVGSIIAGLDGAITGLFRSFGSNTVMVFRIPVGFGTSRDAKVLQRKPLTYEDAAAIEERCPAVDHVAPYLFSFNFGQNTPAINVGKYKGNELDNLDVGGTQESYANGGNVEMQQGRFFTELENLHHMPVVVIGEDVPKGLFTRGEDPLGKEILINGHEFQVIGVMKRPAASFPGQQDLRALLPYFTMHKMFPNSRENMLVIVAREGQLAAATDEARAVLRLRRRISY